MAPKKLTEADKTSILSLYRQPQETTSTLADRYGVSNSTISRLLKASLPEAEYSVLIQQKRGATEKSDGDSTSLAATKPPAKRRQKKTESQPETAVEEAEENAEALAPGDLIPADTKEASDPSAKAKPRRRAKADPQTAATAPEGTEQGASPTESAAEIPTARSKPTRRRRSQAAASPEPTAAAEAVAAADPEPTQLSLPDPEPVPTAKPARPVLKSTQAPPTVEGLEAEADLDDDDDNDDWDSPVLGDDYDDDDGDDGDDDDAYSWEGGDSPTERLRQHAATPHMGTLEIYPLTADVLPPLCYVVVERTSSELVVLPLRTFAELGQIPEAEGESRTLPVFENHNVARRFSRRNQRVVKVPDGTLLQTTSPYLQAKGITRLFIDGQVFSLGQDPIAPAEAIAED